MINIPELIRLQLKEKRKQEKLSFAQVAKQLQIDAATLRRWEKGLIRKTTPHHLRQLQLFLMPRQPLLPSELQCILELYDALQPHYQQKLLKEISTSLSQLLTEALND